MASRIDLFPNMKSSWHQLIQLYSEADTKLVTTHKKTLQKQLNYSLFTKKHSSSVYLKNIFNKGFSKLKKLRPISYYIPDSETKNWAE